MLIIVDDHYDDYHGDNYWLFYFCCIAWYVYVYMYTYDVKVIC